MKSRSYKPRAEYYRDKIAYTERKLLWEYEQLAKIDPNFRPNLVPNNPRHATIIEDQPTIGNTKQQIERG